jgi:hypothetical protein
VTIAVVVVESGSVVPAAVVLVVVVVVEVVTVLEAKHLQALLSLELEEEHPDKNEGMAVSVVII